MISGTTSEIQNLSGRIVAEKSLSGSISGDGTLSGSVSVSVRDVPYYETSNTSGGITAYIAKEVTK